MRRNKLLMVISRTCSVVGCDEYARLTRKYVARHKDRNSQKEKQEVLNIDLCYRHRFVTFEKVRMVGEFERVPGNITRKEEAAESDADGPISKIELDYDSGNAKVV
jgi:hypothetical protein